MRIVGGVLALVACITGFIAAYQWYKASQVPITPAWVAGGSEPVLSGQSQAGWTAGLTDASTKSADLNSIAAKWTAASVAFGSAFNLIGFFQG